MREVKVCCVYVSGAAPRKTLLGVEEKFETIDPANS
jgi:hypothetical protein